MTILIYRFQCRNAAALSSRAASLKYKEVECSDIVQDAVDVLVEAGAGEQAGSCFLNDSAYSKWHVEQRQGNDPASGGEVQHKYTGGLSAQSTSSAPLYKSEPSLRRRGSIVESWMRQWSTTQSRMQQIVSLRH